jgi:hypothetical protein
MGKSGKILEIGAVVDVDRLAEDAVPLSKKILGLSCVLPHAPGWLISRSARGGLCHLFGPAYVLLLQDHGSEYWRGC